MNKFPIVVIMTINKAKYILDKEVSPLKTKTKAGIITFLIATLAVGGGGGYLYNQHLNTLKTSPQTQINTQSPFSNLEPPNNSQQISSSSSSMQPYDSSQSQSFQDQQRMNEQLFQQQVQEEQKRFSQEQENFRKQQAEMQRQFNEQVAQDRQNFSQNMREHQDSREQAERDAMQGIWGRIDGGGSTENEPMENLPTIQEPPSI